MHDTGLIELQHLESAPLLAASAACAPQSVLESELGSDTVAALAHDARNLITALGLYCDLLEEPGVLAPPFTHYGNELRLVMAAGRRLMSKLVAGSERKYGAAAAALPDSPISPWPIAIPSPSGIGPSLSEPARLDPQLAWYSRFNDEFAATPITNLAAELLASRNLLAALAGPGIAVTVDAEGGARGIQMTSEDLTRILVNLVRNAADAMTSGGRIHISLTELDPTGAPSSDGAPARLLLAFEDNGPGIPSEFIGKVFDSGFTTQTPTRPGSNWAALHCGLGLAITRSIIESARGRIAATNRPGGGARFAIELPAL